MRGAQLQHGLSGFSDDRQRPVKPLHPGLAIVEGFHVFEAPGIGRLPRRVDVVPAAGIAGPGMDLVEHVQVQEPPPVEQVALPVDVGVHPVIPLDHRHPVPEVPGVAVPPPVGRNSLVSDMEVTAVAVPHGAASLLEVAAPDVALRVQGSPVGQDVEPSLGGVDRRPALVEPKGALETLSVGR